MAQLFRKAVTKRSRLWASPSVNLHRKAVCRHLQVRTLTSTPSLATSKTPRRILFLAASLSPRDLLKRTRPSQVVRSPLAIPSSHQRPFLTTDAHSSRQKPSLVIDARASPSKTLQGTNEASLGLKPPNDPLKTRRNERLASNAHSSNWHFSFEPFAARNSGTSSTLWLTCANLKPSGDQLKLYAGKTIQTS